MKEVNLSKEFIHSEFGIISIKEFTENDEDLVKSTLLLIKETLIEDFILLSELVKSRDFQRLKSVCHKIKPNLELIGLIGLSAILNQIELNMIEEEKAYSIIELVISLQSTITDMIDTEIAKLNV
jgi:HPt (histidine-containing phosphotransfer) domain-containing protein